MIKIAIIRDATSLYTGGIIKHCNDLQGLFSDDNNIRISDISDIRHITIPIINKKVFSNKALKEYISKSECDIVHFHGFMSFSIIQTFILAKKLKKKIIYSPHYHPFEHLSRPLLGKLYFNTIIKPLLKYVSTIVTINNDDTSFFNKYHNSVVRIPHWYTSNVRITNKSNTNTILFVGRNEPNKGLDHLYSLPKNKYVIHCVTNGQLLRDDFIQHEGIDNQKLIDLYERANVVVVPSRYEAFSLVSLESLCNGTPIVVSDRVRIADYLQNKDVCQIFKYGDYESFMNSIDSLMTYKPLDFKTALYNFNPSAIKLQYQQIYSNVMQK